MHEINPSAYRCTVVAHVPYALISVALRIYNTRIRCTRVSRALVDAKISQGSYAGEAKVSPVGDETEVHSCGSPVHNSSSNASGRTVTASNGAKQYYYCNAAQIVCSLEQ